MADQVIQFRYLRTTRDQLGSLISLLPVDQRSTYIKEIRKDYGSNPSYFLRTHCPSWHDGIINSFVTTSRTSLTAIRRVREIVNTAPEPQGIVKHKIASEETIRRAFRDARPSYAACNFTPTTNRSRLTKVVTPGKRPVFHVDLSPGYARFIKKIGFSSCKQHVILSGYLVMKPFDGGEVWCCEVADTQKNEQRSMFVGLIREPDGGVIPFVHSKLGGCLTPIEKVATDKALKAMKASLA